MKTEEPEAQRPLDEFDVPAVHSLAVEQMLASISQLENDLISEKDKRREHSFYFIAGILFLFSVIMAKFLDSIPMTGLFVVIELFVLGGLAKRLGVDWIVDPINSALEFAKGIASKG